MLAHELRNPLAPIRNAAQVMRKMDTPDPQLHWARDVIDRQVEDLTHLVDDLLDVSRITQGKVPLKKERVDLESVVAALDRQGIRGATARAVPGTDARSVAAAEGATVLREARIRLGSP